MTIEANNGDRPRYVSASSLNSDPDYRTPGGDTILALTEHDIAWLKERNEANRALIKNSYSSTNGKENEEDLDFVDEPYEETFREEKIRHDFPDPNDWDGRRYDDDEDEDDEE